MKKVLLLSTGGTIASVISESGLSPKLSGEDIVKMIPELKNICKVDCKTIFNLDSSNIQPEEWIQLADTICENTHEYDGIVVLHGTDTMAYTASILSFLLQNQRKPVFITGSQLPAIVPNSDAYNNILYTFKAVVMDFVGVYILFDGKIMKGCRAVKVRTTSMNAFESINEPLAGFVRDGEIIRNEEVATCGDAIGTENAISHGVDMSIEKVTTDNIEAAKDGQLYGRHLDNLKAKTELSCNNKLDSHVFLLKLIPGTRPEFFNCFTQMGYKGLVIEGFGLGGIHYIRRNLIDKLHQLIQNGIAVVFTTQCLYETSDLTVYEVGRRAAEEGLIPGYDMTTEAAVTKLMWVLGQTTKLDEVRRMMLHNYCGEINVGVGVVK